MRACVQVPFFSSFSGLEQGSIPSVKRVWCDQLISRVVVHIRKNDCSGGCTDGCCMSVDDSSLISGCFRTKLLPVLQWRVALKVEIWMRSNCRLNTPRRGTDSLEASMIVRFVWKFGLLSAFQTVKCVWLIVPLLDEASCKLVSLWCPYFLSFSSLTVFWLCHGFLW